MKNTTVIILLVVNLLLSAGILTYMGASESQKGKTGYIKINEVYAEFAMTQQLDAKFTNVSNKRQAILDSLQVELEFLGGKLQNGEGTEEMKSAFLAKRDQFLQKEAQFTQDNEALSGQFNQQIMKQLNQYVKEFGKVEQFEYLYGADGSGNLMYANEGDDYTQACLAFINSKFEGS